LITTGTAAIPILLALAANAVMKSVIAVIGGTRQFAVRVLLAFVSIFGAGAAAWLLQSTRVLIARVPCLSVKSPRKLCPQDRHCE
jgi:hypothetical protein